MEKKINRLVVPLTIKSMSLLGAMTIMATSIGGCASKKKNKEEETKTTIVTTSDEEIKTTSNIDITATTIPSETTVQTTTETINDNEVTTTKNTTTKKTNQTKPKTTTKKTQVTTTTTTQSSKDYNDPFAWDYLTKDNINDIEIFKEAVYHVSDDTAKGLCIWYYHYKGETYRCFETPRDEFTYLLASLNRDYITEETLNTLLGSYSEEDLKRFIQVLGTMFAWIEEERVVNNWDGLILDSNIKKQFNDIEKGFLEYLNNNPKPLKELLENYDYNNNPLVGYYLAEACNAANEYSNLKDSEFIHKFSKFYWDMEGACEKEASEMYNKIHGKTKVLE